MSWCSKWIHGNEWPEGVLVTLGRDGNVQRYVPDYERDKLQAENAKLRDEIDQWHRLTAGIELPEYPITEFQPKDLERENAKLRELVRHLYTCMERQEEDGSLLCANCPYENESNECDYELRMKELGVDA